MVDQARISGIGREPTETINLDSWVPEQLTDSGSYGVSGVNSSSFGRLLHSLPTPVLLVDHHFTIRFANQACGKRMSGDRNLEGTVFSDLIPEGDATRKITTIAERVLRTRKPNIAEALLRVGHGSMWGRLHFRSLRIGRDRFIMIVVEDLTSEKRQLELKDRHERALRRAHDELESRVRERTAQLHEKNRELERENKLRRTAENRYRQLFDASPDAILVYLDGTIVMANRAAAELVGTSGPEDLLGRTVTELVEPEHHESLIRRFARVIKTRGPADRMELTLKTEEDEIITVEETASYVEFNGMGAVQCILRDVTLQKKAARVLRDSEERMRRLIEASPIGIVIVQDSAIRYVNPVMVTMFGYETPDSILGQPMNTLFAPESADVIQVGMRKGLKGTQAKYGLEVKGLNQKGRSFDVRVWIASTEFRGRPAKLGFFVDVTQEKALRSQLLHAQKMEAIGTLAGGIAHDFNNILYIMMGYMEMAVAGSPSGGIVHSQLTQALSAGNRARDLIRQILAVGRHGDEEKRPTAVGPIVKETVKFLKATLPSTIEVTDRIAEEGGVIMASPTHMHQVVLNLCTNAAAAMEESGGTLSVEMESVDLDRVCASSEPDVRPGPYVKLIVTDTGIGMTPQVMDRIFEPYFTTKKSGNGTGLGLSVVHGIVRNHGGFIEVESSPGKGTSFKVMFPEIEAEIASDYLEDEAAVEGNERILFVDDEEMVVDMGKQMLERLGYRVTGFQDSREALAGFRENPEAFDLVITDLTMPKLTGAELAREIGAIRPDMPILVCTGNVGALTDQEAESLGIREIILKPVLSTEIARAIRRVLGDSLDNGA